MTSVPLTYAKAHFSELAAKAAQGEEILVTRHEKPLVKLVPANRVSQGRAAGIICRNGLYPCRYSTWSRPVHR